MMENLALNAETLRALGTETAPDSEVESCFATSVQPSCECPPVTNHPEPCWFTQPAD